MCLTHQPLNMPDPPTPRHTPTCAGAATVHGHRALLPAAVCGGGGAAAHQKGTHPQPVGARCLCEWGAPRGWHVGDGMCWLLVVVVCIRCGCGAPLPPSYLCTRTVPHTLTHMRALSHTHSTHSHTLTHFHTYSHTHSTHMAHRSGRRRRGVRLSGIGTASCGGGLWSLWIQRRRRPP